MASNFLDKVKTTGATVNKWLHNHTGVVSLAGGAAIIGGTVWACKKTLDLNEEIKPVVDGLETKKAAGESTKEDCIFIAKRALKNYWAPTLTICTGLFIMNKARCMEKADKEAVLAAFIALKAEYDRRNAELEAMDPELKAKLDKACEEQLGEHDDLLEGKIFEFNSNSNQWTENGDENALVLSAALGALNVKFVQRKPVYVNELMRALGHQELDNGWKWFWYKTSGDSKIDFGLDDDSINYDFRRMISANANIRLSGLHHISEAKTLEIYSKECGTDLQ